MSAVCLVFWPFALQLTHDLRDEYQLAHRHTYTLVQRSISELPMAPPSVRTNRFRSWGTLVRTLSMKSVKPRLQPSDSILEEPLPQALCRDVK